MKKILIHLLKPLSFLPAILMMYLIYSFSAQTGEVSGALSYEVSYQIVETKNEVLNENKTYDELAYSASSIEFYVRKAAHMTEYCLLAIAISFPLYVYGVRGIWLILLAGAICVGFAGVAERTRKGNYRRGGEGFDQQADRRAPVYFGAYGHHAPAQYCGQIADTFAGGADHLCDRQQTGRAE